MSWGEQPERSQLQPLNLGDVLDGMFRILRNHWRTLTLALGALIVPITVVVSVITDRATGGSPGLLEMLNDQEAAEQFATGELTLDLGPLIGLAIISVLSGVLLTPLINGTATVIAVRAYEGGAPQTGEVLRAAVGRYWSLAGAYILQWLLPLLVLIAPVVLVLAGLVAGLGPLTGVGALGFLATAVLAVIVFVRFLFALPVVIVEGATPADALRRSWALVKGRTGVVFGTALVVYLIAVIASTVIGLPFGAAGTLFGDAPGLIASSLANIITTLVSTALVVTAITLMYFDRRIRKEGLDLEVLAAELEKDTGDKAG